MGFKLPVNAALPESSDGSGQTSPHWTLTFLSYENRSPKTLGTGPNFDGTSTREPITIVSDCISLNITEKKEGYSSALVAVLRGDDVNYLTRIGTGDYVIANIVNGQEKAQSIRADAINGKSINRYEFKPTDSSNKKNTAVNDGFKGLFKVQSVRRKLATDPGTGIKSLTYVVVAYSHQELANTIYFIPQLIYDGEKTNSNLFYESINKNFQNFLATSTVVSVQDVLSLIFDSFLGTGFNGNYGGKIFRTPNSFYYIPPRLGPLLGLKNVSQSAHIMNVLLGTQKYTGQAGSAKSSNVAAYKGANPKVTKQGGPRDRFWVTDSKLKGFNYSKPDQFNMIKVGDIIKQNMNEILNEVYVCHRLDPESQRVLPAIVVREKPFTSNGGPGSTKFKELPEWVLGFDQVYDTDFGREESARINFVQVYGRNLALDFQANIGAQIALGNYVSDQEDIKRHGLKPYVVTSNFDFPETGKDAKAISQTTYWKDIIADWVIGSHLKLNGTISCRGIFDPIVPGDNVLHDGVLFHIEGVSHSCTQSNNGKSFRTSLQVSHGVLANQTAKEDSYPEMTQADATDYLKENPAKIGAYPNPTNEEYQGQGSSRNFGVVKDGPVLNSPFLKKKNGSTKKKGS